VNGDKTQLRIEKCLINAPGSVTAQDWSRPIGAPHPEKKDFEDEKGSSSSRHNELRWCWKEIRF
jgi:hypothetical protein